MVDIFSCGDVLSVLALSCLPQGFGTVRFSNTDAAQRAIGKWHEQELEGRRLAVFLDKYA